MHLYIYLFFYLSEVCEEEIEVEKEVSTLPRVAMLEGEDQPTQEELRVAILQETAVVAVKSQVVHSSQRSKSIKELSKMGVGTFSIDEDTAKNLVSGRFVKKIKVKRCGQCKNCRKRNCRECVACLDMPKYGGQGQLKQACIHRRCTDPAESRYSTQTKPVLNHDLRDEDIIEPMETVSMEKVPATEESKDAEMMEDDNDDDNPLNQKESDMMPRIPVPPRSNQRPKYSYR